MSFGSGNVARFLGFKSQPVVSAASVTHFLEVEGQGKRSQEKAPLTVLGENIYWNKGEKDPGSFLKKLYPAFSALAMVQLITWAQVFRLPPIFIRKIAFDFSNSFICPWGRSTQTLHFQKISICQSLERRLHGEG